MHLLLTVDGAGTDEIDIDDREDGYDDLMETVLYEVKHLNDGEEIVIRRADYLVTKKPKFRLIQGGKQ